MTRDDVILVARHWFRQRVLAGMNSHFGGCVDLESEAWDQHCQDELARVGALLDEADRARIVDDFVNEKRLAMGHERWSAFLKGDTDEEDRLLTEFRDESTRLKRKMACAVSGPVAGHLRAQPSRLYFDDDGDLWRLAEPKDPDRTELALVVVSATGCQARLENSGFDRPPGWFPPYGLT